MHFLVFALVNNGLIQIKDKQNSEMLLIDFKQDIIINPVAKEHVIFTIEMFC